MPVSREEARAILDPYLEKLHTCISTAVSTYQTMDPHYRAILSPRSRATFISDFMKQRAFELLAQIPGLRPSFQRGQFLVYVEDKLRLRLKKLDKQKRPSNYLTRRALSFLNTNQSALSFEDEAPPITDVVAGYQWNEHQTSLEGIFVVCPEGRGLRWDFEVTATTVEGTVVDMPVQSEEAQRPVRRVKPKAIPVSGTEEG